LFAKEQKDEIEQPGPPPILSLEIEDDLKAWIVGMQCHGLPVSRDAILIKRNEQFHSIFVNNSQVVWLKFGWLNRFMEQHPIFCLRTAQIVKRMSKEKPQEKVSKLLRHFIERKITGNRIFGMDNAGFGQNSKTNKVVAMHGSKIVWS
jgi:hypothetical protein